MIYSITRLQKQNRQIYGLPNDRLYSVEDLLYYNQKFLFRYIAELEEKKSDAIISLAVSLSWFIALVNRYHLDLESELWKHYAYKCPKCLEIPCQCQRGDESPGQKTGRPPSLKPKNLRLWQEMFGKIYPQEKINKINSRLLRSQDDLFYSYRFFAKERKKKYFREIERKSADYFALLLRAFNACDWDLSKILSKLFKNGCYVCHQTPCECNFY